MLRAALCCVDSISRHFREASHSVRNITRLEQGAIYTGSIRHLACAHTPLLRHTGKSACSQIKKVDVISNVTIISNITIISRKSSRLQWGPSRGRVATLPRSSSHVLHQGQYCNLAVQFKIMVEPSAWQSRHPATSLLVRAEPRPMLIL